MEGYRVEEGWIGERLGVKGGGVRGGEVRVRGGG